MKNTKRLHIRIIVRLLTICFALTVAMIYPAAKVYATDSRDTITIVAGDGSYGYSGDGGPATSAQLNNPEKIALDKTGNIYIVDRGNERIRKVDINGSISTFAGDGTVNLFDGVPAIATGLSSPFGIAVDTVGNVYISQLGWNKADKIDINGIIHKVAGNGPGYSGDGGPAISSKINGPEGITVDSQGNIYIADTRNHCIRKIDSNTGIISTIAGVGTMGYTGDGGPATSAQLNYPDEIALDSHGNIFIADSKNNCIRKVDKTTGIISTVAGNGYAGFTGDGSLAVYANLSFPCGVAIDGNDNIYIAETNNSRIRKVDTSGIISTVADSSSAGLLFPSDVKIDSAGDLYITDSYNNQIKKLTFGRKISGNAGVAGATLKYIDGTEKTVTADASGDYSFTVPYNWTGIVTVSKEGYTFPLDNKIYSHVLVNQASQDYTAYAVSYTVVVNGTVGGIITASQATAVVGDTIYLTITPEAGKQLKAGSLKYNDGTKDVVITGQSFKMPTANVIVKAEFESIPAVNYTVNVGIVTGGSITVNTTSAVSGSVINLTLTPEAGKQLKAGSLKYNDGTKDVAITGTSFTMPAADVIVTAEFETVPLPITGGGDTGGGDTGSSGTGSGGTGNSGIGNVSTEVPADNLPRIQGKATTGWNSISEYIDTVNTGSITVDMNGSTIVKKEVLESIRGKNVTVTFNLEDGVEWIINGRNIPGDIEEVVLKDIDFAMKLYTNNVPEQLVEHMPEADRLQLSLDYNGSFGLTAILKLPMGMNNSGRIAHLFYYNPVTKKLELQYVGRIQEDGEVELQFSHASDYVIVMNENAMLEKAMDEITVMTANNTIYLGGTKGKSLTLNVVTPNVIKKAVTDELCNMSIIHKSSKPKVASISASGKIIAKKAGKTTITTTITINGVKKSIRNAIIVKKANKKTKVE